ncbi:MAG: hypothetical protein JWQ02_1636 [Capsulimonas sp.]|nr:hypothetical protein [Capsulimonas sp.]
MPKKTPKSFNLLGAPPAIESITSSNLPPLWRPSRPYRGPQELSSDSTVLLKRVTAAPAPVRPVSHAHARNPSQTAARYPVRKLPNGQLVSQDPGIPGTPIHSASAANKGMRIRTFDPVTNTTRAAYQNGKVDYFDARGVRMTDDRVRMLQSHNDPGGFLESAGAAYDSIPQDVYESVGEVPQTIATATQATSEAFGSGYDRYITPLDKKKDAFVKNVVHRATKRLPPRVVARVSGGVDQYLALDNKITHNSVADIPLLAGGLLQLPVTAMDAMSSGVSAAMHGGVAGARYLTGDEQGAQDEIQDAQPDVQHVQDLGNQVWLGVSGGPDGDPATAWHAVQAGLHGDKKTAKKLAGQVGSDMLKSAIDHPLIAASNVVGGIGTGVSIAEKVALGYEMSVSVLMKRSVLAGAKGELKAQAKYLAQAQSCAQKAADIRMKAANVNRVVDPFRDHDTEIAKTQAEAMDRQARIHNQLGDLKAKTGDFQGARGHYHQAAQLQEGAYHLRQSKQIDLPRSTAPPSRNAPPVRPAAKSHELPKTSGSDVNAARANNARAAVTALTDAGVAPKDMAPLIANATVDSGLIAHYNHIGDKHFQFGSITDGQSIFQHPNEGFTVNSNRLLSVDGDPAAINHAAGALGSISDGLEAKTFRFATPGETIAPHEVMTSDVQLSLPKEHTPHQHLSLIQDLVNDPRLVDRHGTPLFGEGTLVHLADGEPVFHANSLRSQKAGISANDFLTDVARKARIIKSVMKKHGAAAAMNVNHSIASVSSDLEAPVLAGGGKAVNGGKKNVGGPNRNSSRSQSRPANPRESPPPGRPGGNADNLRGPLNEATADYTHRALEKAAGDPQTFLHDHGSSVNPPPNSHTVPSERAPATAGALSDSGGPVRPETVSGSGAGGETPPPSGGTAPTPEPGVPRSRLERLQQELGANMDTLRQDIHAKLERDRRRIADNDPRGAQHFEDLTDYGALKIAERNGNIRFNDWHREIAPEVGSEVNLRLKRIWDAAQQKYRSAEGGRLHLLEPSEIHEAEMNARRIQNDSETAEARRTFEAEGVPQSPRVYSTWFEAPLAEIHFGRSRSVHFRRMNEALHNALLADPEFAARMERVSPGITERVSSRGRREDPEGFTWEHVSSTAADGRLGVMRLVPTVQHTPGTRYWRVFHRDHGAVGGYNEWAIPFGAPRNSRAPRSRRAPRNRRR